MPRCFACLVALALPIGSALAQAPPSTSGTEGHEASEGLGLDPSEPEHAGELSETSAPEPTVTRSAPSNEGRFEAHGFLRAPMRVGVGPKADGSGGSELHAPARVPDGSFTDWRYLDNLAGPWAELLFAYGGPRAKATISVASYNQSIAGYRELQAQLGINQAFVTLSFPGALGRYGDISLSAGSFSNRYGTSGKNDAGMYETYLFGRTKVAGETLTARVDVTPDVSVFLEHGIGAKLDVIPFETVTPRPEYLPTPGPVPQGSTFLHHAHAGVDVRGKLRVTGHYMTSWTPDDHPAPGTKSTPGRLSVMGVEAKMKGGVAGDAYLGYSHIRAKDILPLADAIEVLHSSGGWQFKNNFFGRFDPRTGIKPPDDTGAVNSLAFQYSISIGRLVRYPTRFSGNGPDLGVTLFGMFNAVDSQNFAHKMLKYGAEVIYSPLEILALGARADLVQPDLADNQQSFSVLSPKLILRTSFLARERVVLQYSRYFNHSRAFAAFPYNQQPEADQHALMISASMRF